MIAYRVEIWCDTNGCRAGNRKGIALDDFEALPILAHNLIEVLTQAGWEVVGEDRHFCPRHAYKKKGAK